MYLHAEFCWEVSLSKWQQIPLRGTWRALQMRFTLMRKFWKSKPEQSFDIIRYSFTLFWKYMLYQSEFDHRAYNIKEVQLGLVNSFNMLAYDWFHIINNLCMLIYAVTVSFLYFNPISTPKLNCIINFQINSCAKCCLSTISQQIPRHNEC